MKTFSILPLLLAVVGCGPPPPEKAPTPPATAATAAAASPRDPPVELAEDVSGGEAEPPEPPSAAADQEPYDIGGDVLPPTRIASPPRDELNDLLHSGRFRWGACTLSSVVNREGEIEQIELLKPDQVSPEIEAVLIRTLEGYRFEPATRDGKPVAVRYHLVIYHCPHWPAKSDPPPMPG